MVAQCLKISMTVSKFFPRPLLPDCLGCFNGQSFKFRNNYISKLSIFHYLEMFDFFNCLSGNHFTCEKILNLIRHLFYIRPKVKTTFDLPSKATHYGLPHTLSKHLFLRNHWAVSTHSYRVFSRYDICLGHLTKMATMSIYG